ncbi:MAG: class I SAM-dependent methyltransferase [bacterium]|nr:class I SAM-dependent methyltransferase [bacterium]
MSRKYLQSSCRICSNTTLHSFLDLGSMPIPNGFLTKEQLSQKENKYPLKACVCTSCWLVQLTHVIPAEIMFRNYVYIPSTSTTMVQHFESLSIESSKKAYLRKNNLVVDIGSNDGTLLSNYKKNGARILGVDPAQNLAKKANAQGIPTLAHYFTKELASAIVAEHGRAKIITATNVIAHIDNLHDAIDGVRTLLHPNGLFVMEAPYLVDLIDNNEFDTIYHEHLSYFAVHPLQKLFNMHNLHIIDIIKQPVHGGTIRVYVSPIDSNYSVHPRVENFITEEKVKQFHTLAPYRDFASRVKNMKKDLILLLKRIKQEGKFIVGYGASAKGNVLENYCAINSDILNYIVDSTPYKQGKYTPGTHIRICSEEKLLKDRPDYALLTSWNFTEEILEKNKKYREGGGQFIIPVPGVRIV